MLVSEIYRQLDAMKDLVRHKVNPDGTIDIDEKMAGIVLEYAFVQLEKAIENGKSANLMSTD